VGTVLDDERVRLVVRKLVEDRPRGYLGTLEVFRHLVELDAARHTAKVESATALPPDQQANVRASLAHVYGQGLTISFKQNPALLGGMRIQVGSDVYDGSVSGRLAELERSF
jgi:F-type H+-transporting ATPase subunit delta